MKRKSRQKSEEEEKKKCRRSPEGNNLARPAGHFLTGLRCLVHPANFGSGRLGIFLRQVEKYGGEATTLRGPPEEVTHVVFEESVDVGRLPLLLDPSSYPNASFVRCSWLAKCVRDGARVGTRGFEIVPPQDPQEACGRGQLRPGQAGPVEAGAGRVDSVRRAGLALCGGGPSVVGEVAPVPGEEAAPQAVQCEQVGGPRPSQEPKGIQCRGDVEAGGTRELSGPETPAPGGEGSVKSLMKPFPKKLREKFACARPSSSKVIDLNSHITEELEKLAKAYKSKNDTWRMLGYQKAISAIRNYPKEITSREEALSIHGVGGRLADKVAEIVESGKLRKVSEVCEGEEAETLKLFMGVWGAGPSTAQSWYSQGFRTLEDLLTKATLTRHQQIGLKHYSDINSRIPREEVAKIKEYVRSVALSIKKGLIVMVCGSYRRGKPNCGDVDILITHPDGHSHENLFRPILNRLRETGFLTDDLVTQEVNGNQQKYLGVCKLPGEKQKHRRLDVIVVPYAEFAPAKMYFTGSAHFNRSMRLLATKMGMSLSEHGLRAGIVRKGREKLTDGCLIDTPTEESIFAHLGLKYLSPEERDH